MLSVVFRADASLQIGTGHVMRCLTLADVLNQAGMKCSFICRPLAGNLIEFIRQRHYHVDVLEKGQEAVDTFPAHAYWLEASREEDAVACRSLVMQHKPDWLVVDHYGLEALWEETVLSGCPESRLLVLDDLADRPHIADILLDQNLGRVGEDYQELLPASAKMLIGSEYALLRPEFCDWRAISLERRKHPKAKNILITMGGVDKDNAAERVLNVLANCSLSNDSVINVVMGTHAPWLDKVRVRADSMPWKTNVVTNVNNMAERMAWADIAIGAAGSTSWERCCLGLPTLMLVLAENQYQVAKPLSEAGAAYFIGEPDQLDILPTSWAEITSEMSLKSMSHYASMLTSGQGASYVVSCLTSP